MPHAGSQLANEARIPHNRVAMDDVNAYAGPQKAAELEPGLELWSVDVDDIHESSAAVVGLEILQRMTANIEKRPWLAGLPFCIIGEEDKIELIFGPVLLDAAKRVAEEQKMPRLWVSVLIDITTSPLSETVAKAHAAYDASGEDVRAVLSDMLEGEDSQRDGEQINKMLQLRVREMREMAQKVRELGAT